MFDYFDKDKDGALNAEEFVRFVNKTLMDGDAEAQMTSDQFVEVARGMGADTRRGILLAQLSKSQDQDTIERAFKRFQICRDRETIVDGKAPQTEKKTLAADSASGRPSPDGVLMEGEIQKRGTLNKVRGGAIQNCAMRLSLPMRDHSPSPSPLFSHLADVQTASFQIAVLCGQVVSCVLQEKG